MTAFRYLGRVLTAGDYGWLAVVDNPGKAINSWGEIIADIEPGGGGSKIIGIFLQIGVAGGVAVWGGDVGAYPKDGAGPG